MGEPPGDEKKGKIKVWIGVGFGIACSLALLTRVSMMPASYTSVIQQTYADTGAVVETYNGKNEESEVDIWKTVRQTEKEQPEVETEQIIVGGASREKAADENRLSISEKGETYEPIVNQLCYLQEPNTGKLDVVWKSAGEYNYHHASNRTIDTVVLHYTTGGENALDATFSWFNNPESRVSSHYVVDRDGRTYQMVREENVAHHAGCSSYNPSCIKPSMNYNSIGIELVNAGFECTKAVNPVEDYDEKCWETYTDEQIDSLAKLVADIIERNPGIAPDREHILGHEEIRRGNPDPGPAFPRDDFMDKLEEELKMPGEPEKYTKGALRFEDVRVTYYYIPNENQFQTWADFARQVRIEGTGKGDNDRYYRYYSIRDTKEISPSYTRSDLGCVIRVGCWPDVHHTIGVNPNYINFGETVYVDLGDSEWSGFYVAGDTGGAFTGSYNGIDIFAGEGPDGKSPSPPIPDWGDIYYTDCDTK